MKELAQETRRAREEANREREETLQTINQVSTEDRELIREQLAWLANHIREKYKFSPLEIRRLLREMLSVTV